MPEHRQVAQAPSWPWMREVRQAQHGQPDISWLNGSCCRLPCTLRHHHQVTLTLGAGKRVVHLIVSRTATGSSVRFAAAFATCFLSSTWGKQLVRPSRPPAAACKCSL